MQNTDDRFFRAHNKLIFPESHFVSLGYSTEEIQVVVLEKKK
jgi:hypothetical protein